MRRRAVVLVAVLVVTALAGMLAASLMFRMRAEVSASSAAAGGRQAFAAAMSGLQRALSVLQTSRHDLKIWYDNPQIFSNQLVCDDGADRWYFTIYAAEPTDAGSVRYGLSDEAGKININAADAETLAALPGMTDELVDCLMDYRDDDDETRPAGAEQDYYDQLASAYLIRNGPFATLEELLLVKGFGADVLYGEDANLNGLLEDNEDDGEETFPPDDGDGQLNTGLRTIATAVSYEPNVDSKGAPRININDDSQDPKEARLSDQTVRFIELYRAEGNSFTHPSELLEMRYQLKEDHSDEDGLRAGDWIDSGVGAKELPRVLDKLTTQPAEPDKPLVGLLNVNTASTEALSALSGIDANLATQIADLRSSLDASVNPTTAWLYTEDLLDAETFKAIAPALTARGYQFHLKCIGFGTPAGRYRIIEAVVDLAGSVPRISYLRDITRLGVPFELDPERLEQER